jgi:hypothetical protein
MAPQGSAAAIQPSPSPAAVAVRPAQPQTTRHHHRHPDEATRGSKPVTSEGVWPVTPRRRLIDRLGFDAVDAGPLENGLALEPDGSPFGVTYSAGELAELVAG